MSLSAVAESSRHDLKFPTQRFPPRIKYWVKGTAPQETPFSFSKPSQHWNAGAKGGQASLGIINYVYGLWSSARLDTNIHLIRCGRNCGCAFSEPACQSPAINKFHSDWVLLFLRANSVRRSLNQLLPRDPRALTRAFTLRAWLCTYLSLQVESFKIDSLKQHLENQ